MEEIITIIEVADTVTKGPLPAMAVAGIASAIPGIAKGIASFFGRKKRKDEERRAQNRRDQQMAAFEATEFTNPYKRVQNEFDDLQVNLQTAQMQQQTAQQLAQQSLSQGIEAGMSPEQLSQRLLGVLNQSQQRIGADLGKQEAMNERLAAQGAMKAQQLQAAGEAQRQQLEMGKQSALLGMANQDLAAAKRARAQAKADLVGGLGALGSAAFSAFGSKIGAGKAGAIGGDTASLGTFAPDYAGSLLANTSAAGELQVPNLAYDSFMQTAFNNQNFSGVDNPAPRNQFSRFTDLTLPKIGG